MRALLVNKSGEKPYMELGEFPKPKPGKNDLLVKIEAAALNRADLLQKAGKYPPPEGESPILGLEMAGVVEEIGSEVSRYKPGDFVFGLLAGGGYAEYCTIHEGLAMSKPDALSFEEVAAIPEVFLTAYQAISWFADLKEGEKILIHAGASGVGTAAIQLATVLKKAQVVATAGSEEKLNLCKDLGAVSAVNYKNQNFAEIIEAELGKNSIDVIIDFIGSPYWEDNIRVLNTDGRLIFLAMMGGAIVEKVSLVPILIKRLTVKGSTLRNRSQEYKIRLTKEFSEQTISMIEKSEIAPLIDSVFDWLEIERAHKYMENNKNAGKIVLKGM